MSDPVSSIRNLGPAVEAMFARVGVTTAEQLRGLGADSGYKLVLKNGTRPHFIGYYALVMGCKGGHGMTVRALKRKTCELISTALLRKL